MKTPQIDFRFLRLLLCIEVGVLFAFVAPFVIGWYCGHGWGLLAAIADIIGWFYLNINYIRKKRLALSTRAIWLLGLAYLVVVTIFELTHLPH